MVNAALRDTPRPDTVSRRTEALVASVAQHHRAISAHQSQLLSAVAELDRRKAWRIDGATTMVSWLVQRCSVTATTAREWVTAAEKLESLPKIAESLSQGKLSFDQIKPLVQVAKPDTDAKLAEAATKWSAKQVRELATAANRQTNSQAAGNYSATIPSLRRPPAHILGLPTRGPLCPGQGRAHCPSYASAERHRDV